MSSVLFVCTGNQYRSPIAAAFFRRLLQERGQTGWRVESAGTWTIRGQPQPADSIRDAMLLGVDIEEHATRLVDEAMLGDFNLILVMEEGQKEALRIEFPASQERVHLLAEMLEGLPFDIPDPLLTPGEHYRVLSDMCDLIERGFSRIVELARSSAGART